MNATANDLDRLLTGTFDLVLKVEQSLFKGTRYEDLTMTEVHTIDAIGEVERTMGEVAGLLNITLATLNAAVTRLCRKGYVQRRRTEEDRRRVLITLTRGGRVVYRFHRRFHQRMVSEIERKLKPEERKALSSALNSIEHYFEQALIRPTKEEIK